MKFLHAAAFAVVLTLASVPVVSAQEPEQDKEKPKQKDEEKKKQPSEKEKPQAKPDEKAKPDTRNEKDKAKPEADRRDQAQPQDERARQDDRSAATHEQHQSDRKDANRGGGHRIPDERFRASFGTEHHFHVRRRDDRRFEYGGYAFEYMDAWPADWSDDDDVYIVLIGDDYYLVDARHPEVRLRLILVD
jgi:hypothetical protein